MSSEGKNMSYDGTLNALIEVKSVSERDGMGYVEGWANVTNFIDRGDDFVERGAFKKTLSENKKYPLLIEHGSQGKGAETLFDVIGVTEFEEHEYGLYAKNEINLSTEMGREVYARVKQMYEHGLPVGQSIGYFIPKGKAEVKEMVGRKVRVIKEVKLDHNSITIRPMNQLSTVTGVKSLLDTYYDDESYISVKAVKSLLQEAVTDTSSKADEPKDEEILAKHAEELLLIHQLNLKIEDVTRRKSKS